MNTKHELLPGNFCFALQRLLALCFFVAFGAPVVYNWRISNEH